MLRTLFGRLKAIRRAGGEHPERASILLPFLIISIGLGVLAWRSYQLSAGIHRQIGRSMVAYAAIIENLFNYENSADAGLAWGLTRRF